jgi:hypothetical protein
MAASAKVEYVLLLHDVPRKDEACLGPECALNVNNSGLWAQNKAAFHEQFLAALHTAALLKTATAFPRAALPFAAGLLPTSRCNGLGREVLMLALFHKRIYEK